MSDKNKNNYSTEKIKNDQKFLSYNLLKQMIIKSDITKSIIEEMNSELWYETLSGSGKIFFENNLKFIGHIKNGMLESGSSKESCTLIFPDGTKYEGEIHNNKISGIGKFTFPTGATYTGEVLNGFRNGKGIYHNPIGITYEGEWKNGLKNGKGKMTRLSMVYEGDWLNGNITGQGKIRWENGNIYEGNFKENHINGFGSMIWYDLLEKYTGNWKNDLQNGNGIHIWYEPKGEIKLMRNRYIGEWVNGIRNGYGIFFYSNGSYYEGIWENNYKSGFGIMTFQDGSKYIGRFEEDRLIDMNNFVPEEEIEKYQEIIQKENEECIKKEKEKEEKENKLIEKIGASPIKDKELKSRRFSAMDVLETKDEDKISIQKRASNVDDFIPKIENKKDNKKNLLGINKNTDSNKKRSDSKKSTKIKVNTNKTNAAPISLLTEEQKKRSINKFNPPLDLRDLIILNNDIQNDLPEIENVLLRNYSNIKKIYRNLIKISQGDFKNIEEFNSSKIVLDTKNQLKKGLNKELVLNNIENNNNNNNKKFNIPESAKINDVSFCITMKDVWNFFRDFNIINKEFTICDFNRLFFNGENNHFDTYQIPEQLIESRDIYDYVNNIIKNSKKTFYYKYKKYLDFYYKKKLPKTLHTNSILYNIEKRIKPEFSIHFFNFIVMPRLFNECLVRAAYLKFQKNEMKLSEKLKELLKILIPEKKKGLGKKISVNKSGVSRLDLSVNVSKTDIKSKAEERFIFYDFMYKYFNSIQNIFKQLQHICNRIFQFKDETITFKFFYNNIIKRSAILKKLIPNKFKFCEIISQSYFTKFIYNKEEINNDKLKYFEIVESYLNNEMIEYEFYELIFNMSKIYSQVKKTKKNVSKRHSKMKRNSKIETEMNQNINYEKIIFFIEQVLNMNKNKKAKYNYVYPIINNHLLKIKVIEEKIRKEKEEKLRQIEKERFMNERKNLNLNDENFHVEEAEDSEDDFDNDDDFY